MKAKKSHATMEVSSIFETFNKDSSTEVYEKATKLLEDFAEGEPSSVSIDLVTARNLLDFVSLSSSRNKYDELRVFLNVVDEVFCSSKDCADCITTADLPNKLAEVFENCLSIDPSCSSRSKTLGTFLDTIFNMSQFGSLAGKRQIGRSMLSPLFKQLKDEKEEPLTRIKISEAINTLLEAAKPNRELLANLPDQPIKVLATMVANAEEYAFQSTTLEILYRLMSKMMLTLSDEGFRKLTGWRKEWIAKFRNISNNSFPSDMKEFLSLVNTHVGSISTFDAHLSFVENVDTEWHRSVTLYFGTDLLTVEYPVPATEQGEFDKVVPFYLPYTKVKYIQVSNGALHIHADDFSLPEEIPTQLAQHIISFEFKAEDLERLYKKALPHFSIKGPMTLPTKASQAQSEIDCSKTIKEIIVVEDEDENTAPSQKKKGNVVILATPEPQPGPTATTPPPTSTKSAATTKGTSKRTRTARQVTVAKANSAKRAASTNDGDNDEASAVDGKDGDDDYQPEAKPKKGTTKAATKRAGSTPRRTSRAATKPASSVKTTKGSAAAAGAGSVPASGAEAEGEAGIPKASSRQRTSKSTTKSSSAVPAKKNNITNSRRRSTGAGGKKVAEKNVSNRRRSTGGGTKNVAASGGDDALGEGEDRADDEMDVDTSGWDDDADGQRSDDEGHGGDDDDDDDGMDKYPRKRTILGQPRESKGGSKKRPSSGLFDFSTIDSHELDEEDADEMDVDASDTAMNKSSSKWRRDSDPSRKSRRTAKQTSPSGDVRASQTTRRKSAPAATSAAARGAAARSTTTPTKAKAKAKPSAAASRAAAAALRRKKQKALEDRKDDDDDDDDLNSSQSDTEDTMSPEDESSDGLKSAFAIMSSAIETSLKANKTKVMKQIEATRDKFDQKMSEQNEGVEKLREEYAREIQRGLRDLHRSMEANQKKQENIQAQWDAVTEDMALDRQQLDELKEKAETQFDSLVEKQDSGIARIRKEQDRDIKLLKQYCKKTEAENEHLSFIASTVFKKNNKKGGRRP
eukprot:TRINITY_DN833_c6_g1_i1.p1 TRINITY_DN833_c6_g1~~TRINITY_DN833_c6_g1_i1.p1  ORF type:complete len:1027 (+),score=303.32 TRINITY_DN833_c6_g1_i1:74-3154(+)